MRVRLRLASLPCLALILLAGLRSAAQNPLGSIEDTLKKRAFEAAATTLLNNQLPIKLDAKTVYPTVKVLPGAPFAPEALTVTAAMMAQPLPPGDYQVNVLAFCTEYSVHRPGRGVAYELAPLEGKAAGAVANILWRGTFAGIAPQTLQGVTWAIQSGLTYAQMPKSYQTLIDQLIADYKKEIAGDFIQQVESAYQTAAKAASLPPLDTLLAEMGKPGQLMLSAEHMRQALLQANTTDEIREQTLFAGQESGVYTPVKAEEGAWTVRIPGVAYMRYQIQGGNLASDNILQIRIVAPASSAPQSSSSGVTDTSLLGLMGVKRSAGNIDPTGSIDASGQIGYSTGQAAQGLIIGLPSSIGLLARLPECSNGQPQPGDVIAYRGAGNIFHTGVVQSVAGGEVTLIESKWGAWGLYKHAPENTLDYGLSWDIYRTQRSKGNLLDTDAFGNYVTDKGAVVQFLPTYLIIWFNKKISDSFTIDQVKQYMSVKPGLYDSLDKVVEQPDWGYNCHGWTFTGGAQRSGDTWIDDTDIPRILVDNGYCHVASHR